MRKPRITKKGAKYHVTARINRQEMLLEHKQLKKMLLTVVKEVKDKMPFLFRNFCIMGNHIHFDIEPLESTSLSRIMQRILSTFAMRYNKMFKLKGHVWYDRFKSKVIETIIQYLNTLFYMANNPVRAGIVNHPLEFEYNGITFHKNNHWPGLLDPLPIWTKPYLKKFLNDYKLKNNKKIEPEYSFRDKKAGRPKK